MLITITIIGILSAGVLAALQGARETAKAAKTKATITKLHYVIMQHYDSYRTRRVPVTIAPNTNPLAAATTRLAALRDLMRMEMPDRWSEVVADTTVTNPAAMLKVIPLTAISGLTSPPAMTDRFFRRYRDAHMQAGADHDAILNHGAAECLYMIVMSIPEASEQFSATEIGDYDGDGLPEFIDGWGHPISFIRWPAGFVEYQNLLALNPSSGGTPKGPAGQAGGEHLEWSSPSDLQSGDRETQPDPFDSMRIGGGFTVRLLTPPLGAGYSLFPLIYSAGSDATYDISIERPSGPVSGYSNPYWLLDPYMPLERPWSKADSAGNTLVYPGQPIDGDSLDGSSKNGALNHYDNIHNHILEVR